jgi:hypothetical protein
MHNHHFITIKSLRGKKQKSIDSGEIFFLVKFIKEISEKLVLER